MQMLDPSAEFMVVRQVEKLPSVMHDLCLFVADLHRCLATQGVAATAFKAPGHVEWHISTAAT